MSESSNQDTPLAAGAAGEGAASSCAGEAHAATGCALSEEELEQLRSDMITSLKTVYDPEIPVDIYELGLIYKIDVSDERDVEVDMTLTAPGCPVAGEMPHWVRDAILNVEGVRDVRVNLTFDPPWTPDCMSDEARVALNMW